MQPIPGWTLCFLGSEQYEKLKTPSPRPDGSIPQRRDIDLLLTERKNGLDELHDLLNSKKDVDLKILDKHLKDMDPNEKGVWLKKFADLGYPGAQNAMVKVLAGDNPSSYGLEKNDAELLNYEIKWRESQGAAPENLLILATLQEKAGKSGKVVESLKVAINQQGGVEKVPKLVMERGLIKLSMPNPADQLSGWRDLLRAAEGEILGQFKRFEIEEWML